MYNTLNAGQKLKKCLVEWHEFELPRIVPRNFSSSLLKNKRILSVIGPRRAGKTYACFEMIAGLLGNGVPRENIIYMNFEDERLVPMDGSELSLLLDVHEELYKRDGAKPLYCFLDEVQNVPLWSKWVRRAVDQNNGLTVVLTGSSSRMLSSDIATELRGRSSSITVFPYSFSEFLRANGYEAEYSEKLPYSSQKNAIKRLFNEYMIRGGFPAVTGAEDFRDTLQNYYRAMFARDMVERFRIKNIRQFEDFLKIQVTRFAALSSISNAEKEMKSLGYSLSKNTLMSYLGYAKDAFLLFDVLKFDYKVTRQLRAPRKLYAVDHGLLNAVRFSSSEDSGRMLENAVFMELRRRRENIYYHSGKAECDFVILSGNKAAHCFQACWSVQNEKTLEREIKGLIEALTIHKLDAGTILTADEIGDIEREGKRIRIRPFWHYALSPHNSEK